MCSIVIGSGIGEVDVIDSGTASATMAIRVRNTTSATEVDLT